MRVDAVGRARDHGDVVLVFLYFQRSDLVRQNRGDLIHFIGQADGQGLDVETVALFHLVEIREELRAREAAVAGDDHMGVRPADRHGASHKMPDRDLQHRLVRPVVNGQRDVNLRNLDVGHDARPVDVENVVVFLLVLFGQGEAVLLFQQVLVVIGGLFPQADDFLWIHSGNRFRVARHGAAGVETVDVVTDPGVCHDPDSYDHNTHQYDRGSADSLFLLFHFFPNEVRKSSSRGVISPSS